MISRLNVKLTTGCYTYSPLLFFFLSPSSSLFLPKNKEGLSDEDITMVDTPTTFPTSSFKSSSTPTSIQIQKSGAAHTKIVAQVAYVLCFGRSTYVWKAKEISFPMDPAPCKNSSIVNRIRQNNMTSKICQGAAPPSFGLLARVPYWPKWWTPPWPPPETLRRTLWYKLSSHRLLDLGFV